MTETNANPCPKAHWLSDDDCFPLVSTCAQCAEAREAQLRAVLEQQAARIAELERLLALADEAAECQNRRVAALERRAHCTCAVDAAANNPRCPIHGTP